MALKRVWNDKTWSYESVSVESGKKPAGKIKNELDEKAAHARRNGLPLMFEGEKYLYFNHPIHEGHYNWDIYMTCWYKLEPKLGAAVPITDENLEEQLDRNLMNEYDFADLSDADKDYWDDGVWK